MDPVERVLYSIASAAAAGVIVALVIGGLKYWAEWFTTRINKENNDDESSPND